MNNSEEAFVKESDSESYKLDSCAEETGEEDNSLISLASQENEDQTNMRRTFQTTE